MTPLQTARRAKSLLVAQLSLALVEFDRAEASYHQTRNPVLAVDAAMRRDEVCRLATALANATVAVIEAGLIDGDTADGRAA